MYMDIVLTIFPSQPVRVEGVSEKAEKRFQSLFGRSTIVVEPDDLEDMVDRLRAEDMEMEFGKA